MPLDIPESAAEVEARSKADVQRELDQSNPFLKNSWLGAIVTAAANRIFDFYLQLKAAIVENFPDTAMGTFLTRWAAIWGIQLLPATKSTGNVVATGVAASVIPISTVMAVSGVGNFISTAAATISAQVININDLTRVGTTVTAVTASDHLLANGVSVIVAGASNSEYNVTAVITVTASDAFEYQIIGSPPDEIGTSATASFTTASVPVQSEDFGASVNLDAGTKLTLQSPIIGVDDTLTVDFGAVGGGTDQESEDSLRARMLDRIQNPVAHFNSAAIISKTKEVSGVTRVFVQEAGFTIGTVSVTSITRIGNVATVTLTTPGDFQSGQTVTITGANEVDYNVVAAPILVESTTIFHYIVANTPTTPATGTIVSTVTVAIGQVRVFFMRDNDINPIPSGSEVATVRTKIESILPANTDDVNDLFVLAPTGVTTDYTFTVLTPNTSTMQDAVTASLRQFYDERTTVGVNIDEDAYRSAIFNTVDTVTGDAVSTFTLSAPVGDIVIGTDEIGVLGNVVYP